MTQQRICADLALSHGSALDAGAIEAGDHVATHFRQFAERASLIALVTTGERGPECEAWGCKNCSVSFRDEKTVVLTDLSAALGTRWLRNIQRDPCVRLLFVIAGASCTLRLSGFARLEPRAGVLPLPGPEAPALPAIVVALGVAYFRRATTSKGRRGGVAA